MSGQIEIDVRSCWRRLETLYTDWKENRDGKWNNADFIVLPTGQSNEKARLTNSLHISLFGYEFPETLLAFTEKTVFVLASSKKVKILQPLGSPLDGASSVVPFEFLTREKEDNTANFEKIIEGMKESFGGKNAGELQKEKPLGTFAESWLKAFEDVNFSSVDVSPPIQDFLAVKDAAGMKLSRNAGAISTHILKSTLLPRIETVIDEEQKVTHADLVKSTEKIFDDPKSISKKLQPEFLESCYAPLVQSGGNYDLRPGTKSSKDLLHFGTIVVALGARYRSYCSNIGRTYFVDPQKPQEEMYTFLLDLQATVLKYLKPGTALNWIYNKVIEMIQEKDPELVSKFTRNCGSSMGIEFSESGYSINAKSERKVKAGMVFNVALGFTNLELPDSKDPKASPYAIFVADTVVVKEDGEIEVLTEKCSKKYSDISYFLGEEEEEEPAAVAPKKKVKAEVPEPKQSVDLVETKFRNSTVARMEEKNKLQQNEAKRRDHQQELEAAKRKEAAERWSRANMKTPGEDTEERDPKSYIAYQNANQFPRDAMKHKITVDVSREAVLLPIYGLLVPFHISMIKNVSKTNEEYLRINFNVPVTVAKEDGGEEEGEGEEDKNPLAYIKELTYRSSDIRTLNNNLRMIKELRKRVTQRNQQIRNESEVVVQEKLILNKGRNPGLADIFVRPSPTGRKTIGRLEAHSNGFRFTTVKGGNIDILYKNIKHAFFQPAEKELLVICHFHLFNAIIIGKKKTVDVQFCTEVMEVSQALDGRYRGGDDNEVEDEQRERALRARLNHEFQAFVKKVEDIANLEFDMPYSELGFHGVPHRSNVLLQPTVHCLVSISEQPFFVMSLSEVEIASFERVQFSLRNFDLVFVLKDYSKPVIHINSISVDSLDTIKEWLDSCDIIYYEGTQTLNWNRIMSVIQANPKKFHTEDGGWSFLNPESSESEQEESSDFEPESKAAVEEDYASESEEDAEEYSAASDEDEMQSDEEGDSEGEDWDRLEEKAAREDERKSQTRQKRGRDFESDNEDDRPAPKKKNKK